MEPGDERHSVNSLKDAWVRRIRSRAQVGEEETGESWEDGRELRSIEEEEEAEEGSDERAFFVERREVKQKAMRSWA
jgi:hypothetical protein